MILHDKNVCTLKGKIIKRITALDDNRFHWICLTEEDNLLWMITESYGMWILQILGIIDKDIKLEYYNDELWRIRTIKNNKIYGYFYDINQETYQKVDQKGYEKLKIEYYHRCTFNDGMKMWVLTKVCGLDKNNNETIEYDNPNAEL